MLNGGSCEKLCARRRKLEEINAFFYHVAGCVRDEVDLRYRFHHHYGCVKGCGCFEVVVDSGRSATTTS